MRLFCRYWFILLPSLLTCGTILSEEQKDKVLYYHVTKGDTVFTDIIRPSCVFGIKNRKNIKDYYRLVYNFGKTYPYSGIARRLITETDSIFSDTSMSKKDKRQYISQKQKELFKTFKEPFSKMTISQGAIIMKLIDREAGQSPYALIKEYKNGFTAMFWQGIAKIFGNDLKKPYDPLGEDKDIEDLIKIWEEGHYPQLYYSIFGEYPNIPEVPSKYK